MTVDRYNLIPAARFQELKERPFNWVIDSSELFEEIFEVNKIQSVLRWAAGKVCTWCAENAELFRTSNRSFKYEHRIDEAFVREHGLHSYSWIRDDEGGYTVACFASDFIDGPDESECWYKEKETCTDLYGLNYSS